MMCIFARCSRRSVRHFSLSAPATWTAREQVRGERPRDCRGTGFGGLEVKERGVRSSNWHELAKDVKLSGGIGRAID
jgi:hypothetical protein